MMTYSEYYELVALGFKKLRKELAEAEQFTLSNYQQAIENETKQRVQQDTNNQEKTEAKEEEPKSKGTK